MPALCDQPFSILGLVTSWSRLLVAYHPRFDDVHIRSTAGLAVACTVAYAVGLPGHLLCHGPHADGPACPALLVSSRCSPSRGRLPPELTSSGQARLEPRPSPGLCPGALRAPLQLVLRRKREHAADIHRAFELEGPPSPPWQGLRWQWHLGRAWLRLSSISEDRATSQKATVTALRLNSQHRPMNTYRVPRWGLRGSSYHWCQCSHADTAQAAFLKLRPDTAEPMGLPAACTGFHKRKALR